MTAENKPDPRVDPEGWCAYWREQIKQAQQQRTVTIAGTVYERVPYGPDSSMVPLCPDCNVAQGELHVPECDVERSHVAMVRRSRVRAAMIRFHTFASCDNAMNNIHRRHQRAMGRINQRLRRELFEEHPLCARCEAQGRVTLATIRDHVVAFVNGGSETPENTQALCKPCHDDKTAEDIALHTKRPKIGIDGFPI